MNKDTKKLLAEFRKIEPRMIKFAKKECGKTGRYRIPIMLNFCIDRVIWDANKQKFVELLLTFVDGKQTLCITNNIAISDETKTIKVKL